MKKRIIANFIDVVFLIFILYFITEFLWHSYNNEIWFIILYVYLIFVYLITSDYEFGNRSLGKVVCQLAICDEKKTEIYDWRILLKRKIITIITFPVSIILLVRKRKTMGDIICHAQVLNSSEIMTSIPIKNGCTIKMITVFFYTLLLGYLFVTYIILQKINYISLRLLLTILVSSIIVLIMLLTKRFERKKFVRKLHLMIISLIIFSILCLFKFEENFLYFTNVEDSFHYSFANGEIIYKQEYDDYAFIFYKQDYRENIIYYVKENNIWNFYNPYNSIIYDFTTVKELSNEDYTLFYCYIEDRNVTIVVVESTESLNSLQLSDFTELNWNLVKKDDKNYYIEIVPSKINDGYISIDGRKYKISDWWDIY